MSSREEYIRKLQAKLEELNVEIDRLSAKAGEVKTEVKTEFNGQLALLKEKQSTARLKIEELRHSGGEALEDLKSGVEKAWSAMGEAIDAARMRFK